MTSFYVYTFTHSIFYTNTLMLEKDTSRQMFCGVSILTITPNLIGWLKPHFLRYFYNHAFSLVDIIMKQL